MTFQHDFFSMMSPSSVHMLQCLKQLSVFTLKVFQNIFFPLGCHLCRKKNKQIDFFPSFLPFLLFSFSFFLIVLSFPFSFLPLFLTFPPLFKVLQSNFSDYSRSVRNDSHLNLHSAFNSCQGFTGIYQK